VGWDGSAQAAAALDAAKRLFGGTGELVLAEVISYEAAEDPQQASVTSADAGLAAIAANADPAETPPRLEVLVGAPAEALAQFAQRLDVDVVVVGRRGRGLTRRLLGSVSSYLLEHSAVPVLIVDAVHSSANSIRTTDKAPE